MIIFCISEKFKYSNKQHVSNCKAFDLIFKKGSYCWPVCSLPQICFFIVMPGLGYFLNNYRNEFDGLFIESFFSHKYVIKNYLYQKIAFFVLIIFSAIGFDNMPIFNHNE